MKIAVCDDERATLCEINGLINKYREKCKTELEVVFFKHYFELKNRLNEFDVYFLDYKMPDIDGLEFAKILHKRYGEKKTIVFITAYPEIVYDTFEVRTFRFMVKPIVEEEFFKVMDSVVNRYNARKKISIKSNGETVNIDIDEIYYITVYAKDIYIHLKDRSILCHKTLDSFEEELSDCGFFRTHRVFLVNMEKIRSFDCKNVIMKNGDKLQMSPRRYPQFHSSYFDE